MSLKAPIEVRSLRSTRITVNPSRMIDVVTADFVSGTPRSLHVLDGVIKAVSIGQENTDLREVNRARYGLKEPEPELTAAELVGATR